ncbi:glycosyltransferase family 1 protein [Pedobacter frigiditerrae]|uniref:Glycosyltransferase family 1 protein n=1 Tax=Pedobacter frigiditerrae TaxID=2530452 RepID=A0A4R0MK74_9SPHI|nr:glycosyltransferase family 1 protein [Pedobacter frigiditerrae]TCC87010.1 glycosyltransferase family 1 protein [Pedobacter frigiditerrae]
MKEKSEKLTHKAESPELEQSSFGLSAFGFKLKIGYDGKRAANNLTGLGNYSRSLIEHLAVQFPENQYFIYTPKKKEAIVNLPLFTKLNVYLELPQEGKSKLFWRSISIKKQLLADKIELFHGLSHEIPFGIQHTGIKSIVTMHDLIFLRKPHYYNLIDRLIYKFKSKYACDNADRIIAISEKTKEDIVELYNINPSKIDVIYQSCDDSFKTLSGIAEKEKIQEKYKLSDKFILNVGTIEARKNLLLIIKALPKIDVDFKLVVVGKETAYTALVKKEIENLGLLHRVIFLKKVPFSDLPLIYQLASLFVLPSYYEGFGIPVIEALYSNVPVIAAIGSCLEEAGGPNSIYVSPDNEVDLANAINKVLTDKGLQETMKQKGLEYVQKFNNEIVNKQLMDCYLKTIKQ